MSEVEIVTLIEGSAFKSALAMIDNSNLDRITKTLLRSRILREKGNNNDAHQLILSIYSKTKFNPKITIEYIYVLWRLFRFDEAILTINMGMKKANTLKYRDRKKFKAALFKLNGNIQYNLGEYQKSLKYHLKSLELYKSIDDEPEVALLNNNIGYTNLNLGDLEAAEIYLQKSL